MSYLHTVLLALTVHIIINFDVLRNVHYQKGTPAADAFRRLILNMTFFYVTDASWALLYPFRNSVIMFTVTSLYFIVMASTLYTWTRYVFRYLQAKGRYITFLTTVGWGFLGLVAVLLAANLFVPVMFTYDETGTYHAGSLRHLVLLLQTLMFFATAVYAVIVSSRVEAALHRRYLAIGGFGAVMTVMLILQMLDPMLPLYSAGCLLGACILHTFVVVDMKKDRRRELEEMVRREEQQRQELGSARHLAYTDSLTGVKSTHAYVEMEKKLDRRIAENEIRQFGVIVFDINGLKQVNDSQGHDAGDRYIRESCRMICRQFCHSPVYRIGGDEFVAILEGDDYKSRKELLASFETMVEDNRLNNGAVVASGLAVFRPEQDHSYRRVFERADQRMYDRKGYLKSMAG